jgi:hypothetical protein
MKKHGYTDIDIKNSLNQEEMLAMPKLEDMN